MADRRITAVLAALLVAGGGVVAVALATGGDSRQEVVADRGSEVMPFSLEATTHVFDATASGGTQRVVSKNPQDREQVRLIRGHLRDEAALFRRGDFADPASIHGDDMPGLSTLEAGFQHFDVAYRDLPDGAAIVYRSDDPLLVDAIADWFNAQLGDHGDHATTGGP